MSGKFPLGETLGSGFFVNIKKLPKRFTFTAVPFMESTETDQIIWDQNRKSQVMNGSEQYSSFAESLPVCADVFTETAAITSLTDTESGLRLSFTLPPDCPVTDGKVKAIIGFGKESASCAELPETNLYDIRQDENSYFCDSIKVPPLYENAGELYLFLRTETDNQAVFINAAVSETNHIPTAKISVQTRFADSKNLEISIFDDIKTLRLVKLFDGVNTILTRNFALLSDINFAKRFTDKMVFTAAPIFANGAAGRPITFDGFSPGYYTVDGKTLIYAQTAADFAEGRSVLRFPGTSGWFGDGGSKGAAIDSKVTVSFSDGVTTITAAQKAITAAEFAAFLSELTDSEKGNAAPSGFYAIRNIISRTACYETGDDGGFIALGIDSGKVQASGQLYNTLDLLPGFFLEIQTSAVLFQPDFTAPALTGYTPGYSALFAITSEDKKGFRLILEKSLRKSVVGWNGVSLSNETAFGGNIDLMNTGVLKSFAKITAPQMVHASDDINGTGLGANNNMAIFFADSYSTLLSAVSGKASPDCLTFRARAALTTKITVSFCGTAVTVPAGTTLADIAESHGITTAGLDSAGLDSAGLDSAGLDSAGLDTLKLFRRNATGELCGVYAKLSDFAGLQLMPGDVINYG
jgi:hypothetical protein